MAKRKVQTGAQEGKPPEGERGVVEQLREAIRQSGESLNHLGKRSGVDSARLSRFMRGQRGLTLTAAEKLCDALGLLLIGVDVPAPSKPSGEKGRRKGKGKE